MKLNDYLKKAKIEHWAVGHFNFSTADQLRAFVEAAAEAKSPIMVATSEGEADFVGMDQAVALVRSYQVEGHAVWLNADHFKSFEKCKAAIDAGYDAILIDASKLPYEENVALTKQVVDYAIASGRDISVEGELGYLRGSSEVQQKIAISSADYTQPNLAFSFVNSTKVDRLAVVFGNIHGIVTEQQESLDIEHFKHIVRAVSDPGVGPFPKVCLVLHGASGLSPADVQAAITAGITNVHINTELRVAYHDALQHELQEQPGETTPYKMLKPSFEASKKMLLEKLTLFGSVNKL